MLKNMAIMQPTLKAINQLLTKGEEFTAVQFKDEARLSQTAAYYRLDALFRAGWLAKRFETRKEKPGRRGQAYCYYSWTDEGRRQYKEICEQ